MEGIQLRGKAETPELSQPLPLKHKGLPIQTKCNSIPAHVQGFRLQPTLWALSSQANLELSSSYPC